ncbi:M66 family metalloprotease [Vibrio hyugaensis]|uniref:M66 family metalloprotease n=1 Tax=Vibrio hyugaensis TaxID=1534743 RepID=UPI000A3DB34A|nr:M66 family metalloprotease [Vibrio hyugaensis]
MKSTFLLSSITLAIFSHYAIASNQSNVVDPYSVSDKSISISASNDGSDLHLPAGFSEVRVNIYNGAWSKYTHLPTSPKKNDIVKINRTSAWNTFVLFEEFSILVPKNTTMKYVFDGKEWKANVGSDGPIIFSKNDGKDLILPSGYQFIDVRIDNGAWSKFIQLPKSPEVGSVVKINRNSDWDTFVLLDSHSMLIPKYSSVEFIFNGNDWITRYPNAIQKESIFFNENPSSNELLGDVRGAVLFAQAHIVPATVSEQEKRMHLVGNRKTKVMFKPENEIHYNSRVTVTAIDRDGEVLGDIEMENPSLLAPNVLSIPELSSGNIDFTYNKENAFNVTTLTSDAISAALDKHDTVVMRTWNGHWERMFELEQNNKKLNGKTFVFISDAGYNSHVKYYKDRSRTIVNGTTTVFKNINGAWVLEDDVTFNKIGYAKGYWSADLPKEWLISGLTLTFNNNGKKGFLNNIKVGAPTELLIHTIDVGMLIEPRGQFHFQKDKEAQREYFETAPVSKLVVSEYEPVYFNEVMLPDGTLLVDYDPSEGGWHSGTMRQRIGKELISIGINNANYGIHSSVGVGESDNPYLAAQLTAHNSRGRYSNGTVTHGGSGGAGMVTLDSSIGNEFSHEVGHNYGLGHYPDGFDGSVHKPAHMNNSTWGWDSSNNVFIPNFAPQSNNAATCYEGRCVPAFNGLFSFGKDAMAGGWAMYNAQRFTLYTPYSMHFIQKNLESKAVFDQTSSTGFRKWNDVTERMEEYTHKIDILEVTAVEPWNANSEYIASLFNKIDKVDLSTWNGHWARNIAIPDASESNQGKVFTFNSDAGYHSYLEINGKQITVPYGSRLVYVSDGQSWIKDGEYKSREARQPKEFGVPVTTLVGYYDPEAELNSYIFPALHGSYGYVYQDDKSTLSPNDCKLEVETAHGEVLKYALKNTRRNANNMNKFHVNIARADNPVNASVICNEKVLDSELISKPSLDPVYTVQGDNKVTKVKADKLIRSLHYPRIQATKYTPVECAHTDGEHTH